MSHNGLHSSLNALNLTSSMNGGSNGTSTFLNHSWHNGQNNTGYINNNLSGSNEWNGN